MPKIINGQETMSAAEYLETVGQLPDHAPVPPAAETAPKRPKYGNDPKWYESPTVGLVHYKSQLEANRARHLDYLKRAGTVLQWWAQYPIYCGFDTEKGTPVRMFVDFKVLWATLIFTWEDTKGMAPTYDWRLKQQAVFKLHGITVKIIRTPSG